MRLIKNQEAIEKALSDALYFIQTGQLTLTKARTELAMSLLKEEISDTSKHVRALVDQQKAGD
jgi:hypothetical protein